MAAAPPRLNLLRHPAGRRLVFAALYFSEGAPIGYIWWALPTKLRAAGVPIQEATGIVALLALPWALKFLWAPLVDTLRTPAWGFRAWIATAQVGMGLALLPLMGLPLADNVTLITALLLVHAMFATTQDVAIDALCVSTVSAHERGAINGWMQVGMLLGRALFGGVVLTLEAYWGAGRTIPLMLACIWSTTLLLPFIADPADRIGPLGSAARSFGRALAAVLRDRRTWIGLLFAATGGAAFEALGAFAGPVLVDHAVPQEQVGLFFGGPVIVAMALGALAGGWFADRVAPRRATLVAGIALALAVAGFGLAVRLGADSLTLRVALGGAYFLIGCFTASSYALFMALTDPRLGGTQFSAFMGATNLCEAWTAFVAGRLAAGYGYPLALWVPAGVTVLALLALRWMRPASEGHRDDTPPAAATPA